MRRYRNRRHHRPNPIAKAVAILLVLGVLSLWGSCSYEAQADSTSPGVITENDPGWACWAMGNHICSPLPLTGR